MYLIRDRKTQRILHIDKAPLSAKLKATDVYPKFDKATMELLKTDLETLPRHYKVDGRGNIKPLSVKEQVVQGLMKLQPHQEVQGDAIVNKPLARQVAEGLRSINEPFEYVDDSDSIATRTPQELVDGKHIKTREQLEAFNTLVNAQVTSSIWAKYNTAIELRITKDFALWLYEGRPANDAREQAMLDMEHYVQQQRSEAAALKAEAAKNAGVAVPAKPEPKPIAKAVACAPEPAATAETPEVPEEEPDEFWTVSALRAWMNQRNISYVNRDSKNELLEKIKAARA